MLKRLFILSLLSSVPTIYFQIKQMMRDERLNYIHNFMFFIFQYLVSVYAFRSMIVDYFYPSEIILSIGMFNATYYFAGCTVNTLYKISRFGYSEQVKLTGHDKTETQQKLTVRNTNETQQKLTGHNTNENQLSIRSLIKSQETRTVIKSFLIILIPLGGLSALKKYVDPYYSAFWFFNMSSLNIVIWNILLFTFSNIVWIMMELFNNRIHAITLFVGTFSLLLYLTE